MRLGRIEGKVWATVKDERLKGLTLYIMQPLNEDRQPSGSPVVAVDTVGAREGDMVFWVMSSEACFVLPDRPIPSEASIVGLVDRLDTLHETKERPEG